MTGKWKAPASMGTGAGLVSKAGTADTKTIANRSTGCHCNGAAQMLRLAHLQRLYGISDAQAAVLAPFIWGARQ